jgi:starvation-inducible DNA-binding protein
MAEDNQKEQYSKSIIAMNQLVADAQVLLTKTWQAHWYMLSDKNSMNNFIPLHDYYDTYLDWLVDLIDDVAERVIQNNGSPKATLREMLSQTNITEEIINFHDESIDKLVARTVADFKTFRNELKAAIIAMDGENDISDSNKFQDYLSDISKFIWFLNASIGKQPLDN